MQMLPEDQWGVVVSNYRELYPKVGNYTDQLRALEKQMKDKPDSAALRFPGRLPLRLPRLPDRRLQAVGKGQARIGPAG